MQAIPALTEWRMYCQTESQSVYIWIPTANGTPPAQCPNNTAHTIAPNSLSIYQVTLSNQVAIKESNNPNIGGNFQECGLTITVPGNSTQTATINWPNFPISLFSCDFISVAGMENDIINAYLPFNMTIGILSADLPSGSTMITVTPTIIGYLNIGYLITLTDGTNTNNCGPILNITGNIITLLTATTVNFSAATPTAILLSVQVVQNYVIGFPGSHLLGGTMIGGTSVPMGITLTIQYTNTTADTKTLYAHFPYRY